MDVNVAQIFAKCASLSPATEALAGKNYRYNFPEANRRVNRIAALLRNERISRPDRIALLGKHNEHVAASLLGAAKIGALTGARKLTCRKRLFGPAGDHFFDNLDGSRY